MTKGFHKFTFGPSVRREHVAGLLGTAVFVAECICGKAAVRIGAECQLDHLRRVCLVRSDTSAGRIIARVLLGLLNVELVGDEFSVRRTRAREEAA
jgi:hypothetical protein